MIANIHPVRYAATYPTHIVGRLGWHTADTAAPIGTGTCAAACAATDVATTAAQLVMDGEDAAYALCRPPGHHAYARHGRRLLLPQQQRDRSRASAAEA